MEGCKDSAEYRWQPDLVIVIRPGQRRRQCAQEWKSDTPVPHARKSGLAPKTAAATSPIGPQSFLPSGFDLLYGDDLKDCPVAAHSSVPVGELTHDLDVFVFEFLGPPEILEINSAGDFVQR